MKLSRTTMLDRMMAADPAYDGQFITGVISTGIYCLPSCRARKPLPQHVVFYPSPQDARTAGLRACLRCRPDGFYLTGSVDETRIQRLISAAPDQWTDVTDLAHWLGLSPRRLTDLMQAQLHCSPSDWLTRRRIQLAQERLLTTTASVADIAFSVGFQSLSVFNAHFRRLTATSPVGYRGLCNSRTAELSLTFSPPLPLWMALLGRDPTESTARLEGHTFEATTQLPSGPAVIQMALKPGRATLRLHPQHQGAIQTPADAQALHQQVCRLLGVGQPTGRFEAHVTARTNPGQRLIDGQHGLPCPLTPTLFDGVVWAVAGQQVSFAVACRLRRRLLERLAPALPGGLLALPTPQALAALTPDDLGQLGFMSARAELLVRLAQAVLNGTLPLDALAQGPVSRAERTLQAISGLGPWSTGYLLLRAFGRLDALPLGDRALATSLQRFYGLSSKPTRSQTQALMAAFRPYRGLATAHFWQRLHP